jgi:hypothetical protein
VKEEQLGEVQQLLAANNLEAFTQPIGRLIPKAEKVIQVLA